MFRRISQFIRAGALILGGAAVFALTAPVPAAASPPGSIDLHTEWDVYQRPSGTTDRPLGFHVKVRDPKVNKEKTALLFHGFAHTTTYYGEVLNGRVQGRSISFTIEWSNGKTGFYQGSLFDDGYLRGNTKEKGSANTAEWWSAFNDWTLTPKS